MRPSRLPDPAPNDEPDRPNDDVDADVAAAANADHDADAANADVDTDLGLGPAETALAAALSGLRPADAGTSLYRAWYRAGVEAGVAAGRREARAWRFATCGAAAAAVALAVMPWVRPPGAAPADPGRSFPRTGQLATATGPADRPITGGGVPHGGEVGGSGGAFAASATSAGPANFLDLRDQLVRDGWDNLPPTGAVGPKLPEERRPQARGPDAEPFDAKFPFDRRGPL